MGVTDRLPDVFNMRPFEHSRFDQVHQASYVAIK